MITRGMQRMSYGPQSIIRHNRIRFDKLITSWVQPGTNLPDITYSNGTFTIRNTSLSDYLVTWTFAFKTYDVLDYMKYDCLFDMDYQGSGFVTEGCSGSLATTMGILKGFKVIHVLSKTINDTLYFSVQITSDYSTAHLSTPAHPLPNGLNADEIANATISVISL